MSHCSKSLNFLSKNSTLISRENCRFFWGRKTRENVLVLDFLVFDNFDFTRNCKKKLGEKLVKMLGLVKIEFLDKNLTFRIVCENGR